MPRAGLAPEQLGKGGGLSFEQGNGKVINAMIVAHQFPPSKKEGGGQESPRSKIRLTIQRLGADWKPTVEEPIDEYIPLTGTDREGQIPGLDKIRPGNAQSSDDDDPEDLGAELDTEGNCIFAAPKSDDPADGFFEIHQNSKAGLFTMSLADQGFRHDLLNGYMPNLIGLEAHFTTRKMKAIEEGGKDYPVLIVDKINRFPYQKGGVKATVPAAVAGKPAAKAPVAAASAAAPARTAGKAGGPPAKGGPPKKPVAPPPAEVEEVTDDTVGEVTAEFEAMRIIEAIGEKKAGQTMNRGRVGVPSSRLQPQIVTLIGSLGIDAALHADVNACLGDTAWLAEATAELGWVVTEETVTIP